MSAGSLCRNHFVLFSFCLAHDLCSCFEQHAHWQPAAAHQRNCFCAAQEVLQGRAPTAADVDRLPYCTDVLLETLRVHPPAYMIGRCAAAATSVRAAARGAQRRQTLEYTVAKGTTALVSPYLMHTSAVHWGAQAESFQPWRWAQLRERGLVQEGWRGALAGNGPHGAYLPFGGGPRNCIGTGFAMMEAVLVLACLLQRWRLTPPREGAEFPRAAPLITLRPERVDVRLHAR